MDGVYIAHMSTPNFSFTFQCIQRVLEECSEDGKRKKKERKNEEDDD